MLRQAILVAVAQVVRVRGLRGEVVADLLTDFPERFEGSERLIAVLPDGRSQSLALEDHWLQGKRIVLKFAGYDSMEAAGALVGYELTVLESERVELAEDEYYDWELAGCRVESIDGQRHRSGARSPAHGSNGCAGGRRRSHETRTPDSARSRNLRRG